MKIAKAEISDAETVGYLHSTAWKQAYVDLFPEEYLRADTPDKRKHEFLDACDNQETIYYLLYEEEQAVGIAKLQKTDSQHLEIASLYILDRYRNKGYGRGFMVKNNGFCSTGEKRNINRGQCYTQLQYEYAPPEVVCALSEGQVSLAMDNAAPVGACGGRTPAGTGKSRHEHGCGAYVNEDEENGQDEEEEYSEG